VFLAERQTEVADTLLQARHTEVPLSWGDVDDAFREESVEQLFVEKEGEVPEEDWLDVVVFANF
jgi:transcriptional regulator of nitric oxide reductase